MTIMINTHYSFSNAINIKYYDSYQSVARVYNFNLQANHAVIIVDSSSLHIGPHSR